ncbi:2-hydroxyacid dehydrogenase [Sphingomonas sp. PAMC 26617]|uniref:2-hydroxyacid dehydrogenase n=1 Tax=Sphingomonas sp. PAMC 26617 TaxID=1112216 RepID=UPI0002890C9B|nr:D-glycerate dehydrogenase [Sphingomonas sp. PAMC 26617]
MTRARIFVTRRLPEAVEQRLAASYEVTINADDVPLDRAALTAAMREQDVMLPTITDRIDAALLATSDCRVRLIANYGAGTDHIDLGAARAAGVTVTNTPGALTETTAELAILLMLMAARRAGEGERELRAGRWTGWRPTHLIGSGLTERSLGLVGFGRIAQATARRARAMGMSILYYSRSAASAEIEAECGAKRVDKLVELVASVDVLSLHVPGGVATEHLIDAKLLAGMKPGAILVNTARGTVVDERALAVALRDGPLAAAGLDVYEREPSVEPALLACENAVLLPHLGSATTTARVAMGMQAADAIDAFFAGQELTDRVA